MSKESRPSMPHRYYLLDQLKEARDHNASMCALYTHAGLYDLAKDRASLWAQYDLEYRQELDRVTDETLAVADRLVPFPTPVRPPAASD